MPDIVAHNRMAYKVLKGLDNKIVDNIDTDIFRFSIMWPDIFLHYLFFIPKLRRGIDGYSKKLHKSNPGELFTAIAKTSNSRATFSFLMGIICHYALDCTCHPYINKLSGSRDYMHGAIEHSIDSLILEQEGKALKDVMGLFTEYYFIPDICDTVAGIYNWNARYEKTAYRHFKLYVYIAKDQHGFIHLFTKKHPGRVAAISYRNNICNDKDLIEYFKYEVRAIDYGKQLVAEAYRYIEGYTTEESFRGIIGNRNFAGEIV